MSCSKFSMQCGDTSRCVAVRLALGAMTLGGLWYWISRLNRKIRLGAAVVSRSWFSEMSVMWPGQAFSLEIDKVLFEGKSDHQTIGLYQTATWGRMLALDGVIQVTERDEFSYQEMLTHVPLLVHPHPRKALVVGGGDGGILRELSKYDSLNEIHICEIDQKVIDVAKQYLPSTSVGFSDPRVRIHIGDGFEFLKSHTAAFDVIIVDSSDPVGPASCLFEKPFYEAVSKALTANGVVAAQAENFWIHLDVVKRLVEFSKGIFANVDYGVVNIPTYPCGSIGILCCTKSRDQKGSVPVRNPTPTMSNNMRYYTTNAHKAAFVLPKFVEEALGCE